MTATLPRIHSASTNIKQQSSEPKPEPLASNLFPLNRQHQWFLKSMTLAPLSSLGLVHRNQFTRCDGPTSLYNQARLLREGSMFLANSTGAAEECIGPFDKLRAGSSARKQRGP